MKTFKTRFMRVIIILLSLMLLLPAGAFAKSFGKIVAFGDSLSDHHGLEKYIGLYNPVTNLNGALEAWTNGDVWVEYLAAIMGATLENDAIAGAMTDGHENADIQAMSDHGQLPQLGLVGQINRYVDANPAFVAKDTLFTIWIGGNDLLQYARGESTATSVNALLNNAIDNIINSMSKLAGDGATHFLVLNLPDLGKTPAFNSRTPAEIAAITTLTVAFNSALETGLTNFKKLFPEVTIYTFDVYTYMNQMIGGGAFPNTTGTYMALDANGNYTGAVNGPADDYLFWDSIHPTTKAHEMVAVNVDKQITDADTHDNDDNSCFITSVRTPMHDGMTAVMIIAVFSIAGIAGWVRKNH
ncbi:MAG: SGNH/GDSL hydrolase family protein [Desulfobacteraceae bacterium]|nr:SGNH/GDSL hydrolase family protein [Desulfobacteraceae bacterium]